MRSNADKHFVIPCEIETKPRYSWLFWKKKGIKTLGAHIVDTRHIRDKILPHAMSMVETPRAVQLDRKVTEVEDENMEDIDEIEENINGFITCGMDRIIMYWDAVYLEQIEGDKKDIVYTKIIQMMDKECIAAGTLTGEIDIFKLPSFTLIRILKDVRYSGRYISALCQINSEEMASGGANIDGNILIWQINTSKVVDNLEGHKGGIFALRVCGGSLFSGGNDGLVIQWDLDTLELLHKIDVKSPVLELIELPFADHDEFPLIFILRAIIKGESQLLYWDLHTLKTTLLSLHNITTEISSCYPIDSLKVALGDQKGYIGIYNIKKERFEEQRVQIHNGRVVNIASGGEGKLISCSRDKSFKLSLMDGTVLRSNIQHIDSINHITTIFK